ncbi:MAG TPA: glutaredoxin family protein [Vicinamibacteria bacterium]|nr:glutaredoxin family protein [Vicinamibacteria bacterium]
MIELELLSRAGCGLCEEMKAALERALFGLDVRIREVDVDAEPQLRVRYGDDVPVLLMNGVKMLEHRATDDAIRELLATLRRS